MSEKLSKLENEVNGEKNISVPYVYTGNFPAFSGLTIKQGDKFKLRVQGNLNLTRLIFFINLHNDGDDRILDINNPTIGETYEFTARTDITSINVATFGSVVSYNILLELGGKFDTIEKRIDDLSANFDGEEKMSNFCSHTFGFDAFDNLNIRNGDNIKVKVLGDVSASRFIIYTNGSNQSQNRLFDGELVVDSWINIPVTFDITKISSVVTTGSVNSYRLVLWTDAKINQINVKNAILENGNIEISKFDGTKLVIPSSTDILNGKKWAVCGDSFTYGDFNHSIEPESEYKFSDGIFAGQTKTYPRVIATRTGIVLQQIARGGRTMATPSNISLHNCFSDENTLDFGGNYKSIDADVDYITLYFGINDSNNRPSSTGSIDGELPVGEIPVGEITDTTINTYCGAYNVVLDWLIVNRPFAHIGVIVSNGCATDEYRQKTIAICKKKGIPYIDMNGDERTPCMLRSTNASIDANVRTAMTDAMVVNKTEGNIHPNAKAHLYESYFIENFLRSL